MAKVRKVQKSNSRRDRVAPYTLPSCSKKDVKEGKRKKKCSKSLESNDWKSAKCSVCLEYPHNAVLLLCSSYHKGCRPYMCATSRRFANCLEQYKKAYTKVTSTENTSVDNSSLISGTGQANGKVEVPELLCPLCRGQVKGWTVVEPARKYLNGKRRACMQENCSFVGTYKELRRHVRSKHPLSRPRAVDPVLEEKWKKLEHERERNDVITTIMSSTPGAVVLGDYVLEPSYHGVYEDDYDSDDSFDDDGYLHLDFFGGGQSGSVRLRGRYHRDYDSLEEADFGVRSSQGQGARGHLYARVGMRRTSRGGGRSGGR